MINFIDLSIEIDELICICDSMDRSEFGDKFHEL